MTFPLALVCWIASVVGATDASPQRTLFLDPAAVTLTPQVALCVHPPERREIVIRADQPWEQLMISFYLTVLDEDGRLRMWYICRDRDNHGRVAYAESRDGVTWTKPHLGLVDHGGNRDNNLVNMTSLEGAVYRDPHAAPQERYVYLTHGFGEGMVRYTSPDGLRWNKDRPPLIPFGADTQNIVFWDDNLKRYVVYLRGWQRGADKLKYRKVVRTTLPDLSTPLDMKPTPHSLFLWKQNKIPVISDELPTVLAVDDRDPPNSDVYTISAQLYPLDPRWYLGFPSFFQRERGTSDGRLEVQCVGSRDGIAWHRYDRRTYAAPGPEGSESANMTFMGVGMVVRGDEIWQYGTGFHSRHGDVEARRRKTDGVIYRYVQRVDGFVALDFADEEGRATTRPGKIAGSRLLLNLDTGAMGRLRVALVTADGQPIPGYSADDCRTLRTNSTGAQVAWTEHDDLANLKGQTVRLVFVGARAKLFSYRFE